MYFLLSLLNWKTSKEGKDGKVRVCLIILHTCMPSDNCNNAHVTELRCVIIGNFRFSNCYQSEAHDMALFKVQVMCHRLMTCARRSQDRLSRPSMYMSMLCGPLSPHFYMSHVAKKRVIVISKRVR